MLKMPYIHYIDVKSNEQHQQEITGLTYKSVEHPCSLACLIMICSLLDVTHHGQVVGFVLVLDHDSSRRCCLWNEVTLTEEVPPFPTGFYNASLHYISRVFDFTAHQEEVGEF
jgi:hypothetical protein